MLKRILAAYVLIACFYSAILFVIVYAAAWKTCAFNFQNRPRQWDSEFTVQMAIEAIGEYQKDHGTLPPNLTDKSFSKFFLHFDPQKGVLDAWGRPLHYEVKGKTFTVTSFGRDGRPGGVGIDADISGPRDKGVFILSNAPNVGPLEPPTFEQFVTTRDSEEIAGSSVVMWATLCGILVFGVMFLASFRLWGGALRNVSRILISGIATLPERSEAAKRAESELIAGHVKLFAMIDPGADAATRIGSVLRFFYLMAFMVIYSMGFAFFITLLHIRTGH